MKFLITFRFWLGLISLAICILNALGLDDMNILLFFSSPPSWVFESHWFAAYIIHPASIPIYFIYFITVIFWISVGVILDKKCPPLSRHGKNESK